MVYFTSSFETMGHPSLMHATNLQINDSTIQPKYVLNNLYMY